jgi:curved DNA-binding protein
MDYKDYYKILGIGKQATTAEIKKAYRKLAIKHHPDKNAGDKTAEEKFKEINEANNVLSDPEKRKKYDELGENWKQYQQTGADNGNFDFSNWANRGSAGGGRRQQHSTGGNDFDGGEFSDFFSSIFGNAFGGSSRGGGDFSSQRQPKPRNYQAEITISLEDAYEGGSRVLTINDQKFKVNIPAGVTEGQVLRLKGLVGGTNGAPKSDLLLTIHVEVHPHFERKGNDLYCTFPLDLYTAILGGKALLRTMKGTMRIDIKAGTDNGQTLRLKGLGMPVNGGKGQSGDLYAKNNITLPKNLSDKEKELFNQLANLKKEHHAEII